MQEVLKFFLSPAGLPAPRKRELNLFFREFAILCQRAYVRGVAAQKGLEIRTSAFIPVGTLAGFELPIQMPQPHRLVLTARKREARIGAQTDGPDRVRVSLQGVQTAPGRDLPQPQRLVRI